jgi:tetratricopeptide (TPR) repeat protein
VWLFEGLRAAGVQLDDTHTVEGEVQFPAETLGFRTGNRRDIGLLWAAALEAAGIPCALIPLEPEQGSGDFVIAFYLAVNQAGAGLLFNGLDRVLVIDGQAWLPLSMNAFNNGFMAAWDGGAEALNTVFAEGREAEFIMPENAWSIYPPALLPAQGSTAVRAGGGELAAVVDSVMRQYVSLEIQSQVEALQRQLAAAPSAALYNRLGILLIRSRQTADAKAAYERAASMGSVPAMTNRGNLALIEKDHAAAEQWFRQALAREPENPAALRGLQQAVAYREIR